MDVWKINYRPDGGHLFMFPTMAVWAPDMTAARVIAGGDADGAAYFDICMDSAEASSRLGIWGKPDLLAAIERGD